MKRLLLLITLIGICASSGFSQKATPKYGTDFQFWNDTQIIFPLDKEKDWTFAIWIIDRYGNDLRTVTDARIGGLLSKKVNNYLTLGAGYLYHYGNTTFVQPKYDSRYIGQATITAPLGHKFTFVNRDEVQYESRYSRPNAVVFRPKLTIKREFAVADKKIEAFVSWEPFYDSELHTIARYREQVGISHRFSSQFSADLFYVRQDETGNHTRPGTLNGFGTSFKINVR